MRACAKWGAFVIYSYQNIFKPCGRMSIMEIEVIYENGVFRPLQKVDLKEGTTMKIPMKKLAIPKYYKSIPIRIDEAQIEEARMEMLERE